MLSGLIRASYSGVNPSFPSQHFLHRENRFSILERRDPAAAGRLHADLGAMNAERQQRLSHQTENDVAAPPRVSLHLLHEAPEPHGHGVTTEEGAAECAGDGGGGGCGCMKPPAADEAVTGYDEGIWGMPSHFT